ncbi:MAG: carboxymuconolactone decarboxylase family protein [Methylotenera sp.]
MAIIQPVKVSNADANTATTLNAVKSKLGMVPNLIATFAHSKPVLDSYLQFSENLTHGLLTGKQREMIALAVAQVNLCRYCLSAHTMLGKVAGLNEAEIDRARRGGAVGAIDDLIVSFAKKIVVSRGMLDLGTIDDLRAKGLTDALIIEVIANVIINIMTNYTNNIADTVVDFPLVNL